MEHRTATKAVLWYTAGTLSCGITFRQINTLVGGYSDTDYAGDSDTEGPLLAVSSSCTEELSDGGADCSLQWQFPKQEAEYMASAQAVREALWLRKLLGGFWHQGGDYAHLHRQPGCTQATSAPYSFNSVKAHWRNKPLCKGESVLQGSVF